MYKASVKSDSDPKPLILLADEDDVINKFVMLRYV